MKKKLVTLLLFTAFFISVSLSVSAQIYVNIRPIAPVVVITQRPGPTYIWITEEWYEDGGHYRYGGGHWENPPHHGDRWQQGHWSHHPGHGDRWVRGSWKGSGQRSGHGNSHGKGHGKGHGHGKGKK